MKILHFADFHIGHKAYGLKARKRKMLENISSSHEGGMLDVIARYKPDAVLVSGDIFDNPEPTFDDLYHFKLFCQAAQRAPGRTCPLILCTGNHDKQNDSAVTLSEFFNTSMDVKMNDSLVAKGVRIYAMDFVHRNDLKKKVEELPNDIDILVMHQSMCGFLPTIARPEIDEEIAKILSTKAQYIALGDLHIHRKMELKEGVYAAYPGTVDFLRYGEESKHFKCWKIELEDGKIESISSIRIKPLQNTEVIDVKHIDDIVDFENKAEAQPEDFFFLKDFMGEDKPVLDAIQRATSKNPNLCVYRSIASTQREEAENEEEQYNRGDDFIQVIMDDDCVSEKEKDIAVDLWRAPSTKAIQGVLESLTVEST